MEIKLSKDEYALKLHAHGLFDYDVIDPENIIHRVVTRKNPEDGDLCNVYCLESTKWGLVIDTSKTLVEQLKEIRKEVKEFMKTEGGNNDSN